MKPVQLDLHIEALILRDLPYTQRHRIAEAIEEELTRLLTIYGLPPVLAHGSNIPHIAIDTAPAAGDAGPSALGAHIAQTIYHTLASNEQAVPAANGNPSRRKE